MVKTVGHPEGKLLILNGGNPAPWGTLQLNWLDNIWRCKALRAYRICILCRIIMALGAKCTTPNLPVVHPRAVMSRWSDHAMGQTAKIVELRHVRERGI